MNRTRWKLMIGAFGLGAAGLAAVAAGPGSPGCTPTTPATAKAPADLPKVPSVPALPSPPADVKPAGLEIPAPPSAPPALPVADLKPLTPPSAPKVELEVKLPAPPANKPEPAKPATLTVTAPPGTTFVAAPELPKASPPAAPAGPTPPPVAGPGVGTYDTPTRPADTRIPPTEVLGAPQPPMPSAPVFSEPAPVAKAIPAAATAPAPAAATTEKKLTVLLHMGDERPKFEVKDQSEVYLKVVSDKVDVQSAKDGRANQSVMRAAGKVVFVTPGGEGTCDELAVVPGTGQVTVTGSVQFTYNWGKVETTVSGEKMTFRLGGTPGATSERPVAVR